MMLRLLLMLLGSVAVHPVGRSTDGRCRCDEVRISNGWCHKCSIGYVAAVKIESQKLFEAIDAHGHQTDPKSIRCQPCKKAIETDGFCKACKTGFVKRLAYFSKLTYYLARGDPKPPSDIDCTTCRSHADRTGWCDNCKTGMVGRFAFTNQDDYEHAANARAVLIAAISKVNACETCAIAMAVDRRCYTCKISYMDGKPTGK